MLRAGSAGDWTDDVYAIWEDRSYESGRGGYGGYGANQWIRVQCSDGRIIEGPAYYTYGACNNDVPDRVAPPLRDPEQPDDSSSTGEPSRYGWRPPANFE